MPVQKLWERQTLDFSFSKIPLSGDFSISLILHLDGVGPNMSIFLCLLLCNTSLGSEVKNSCSVLSTSREGQDSIQAIYFIFVLFVFGGWGLFWGGGMTWRKILGSKNTTEINRLTGVGPEGGKDQALCRQLSDIFSFYYK